MYIIEVVDRALEALEIVAALEGLEYLSEDVFVEWSVEAMSEAKTRHH